MTRILTRPRNDAAFFPKFMGNFFEDMNQDAPASQTTHQSYVPRVDISEDASNIYVHAELPGLSKDDVRLTVCEGTLILRGEKKHQEKNSFAFSLYSSFPYLDFGPWLLVFPPCEARWWGSNSLYATHFRDYFIPLPGCFSPFPHGTIRY